MEDITEYNEPILLLPFVHIRDTKVIHMGPITFWPITLYKKHLNPGLHDYFRSYIDHVWGNKTPTTTMTCVSVDPDLPEDQRHSCLVEALSLLYFTAFYQDLYYNVQVPPFQTFTKVIPADPDFLQICDNCDNCRLFEHHRREPSTIQYVDHEMARAFGCALALLYLPGDTGEGSETISSARRIIRSVRFFIHGSCSTFDNIMGRGLQFKPSLFEPEDIMFLSNSFESLLDLNPEHISSDFKFKTRTIMHLEYSTAMDTFWKWVDGFFELKDAMVHRGESPNVLFRGNPCFEVSHIYLGTRLFIYILQHMLSKHGFLAPMTGDQREASLSQPVRREEIIVFFWSEEAILECIECNLANWKCPKSYCIDHRIGQGLVSQYCTLFRGYYSTLTAPPHSSIQFIPQPKEVIEPIIKRILDYKEVQIDSIDGTKTIASTLPAAFWNCLKQRLED